MNALKVHFRDWVMKGTPPPPSRYPTLGKGTLDSLRPKRNAVVIRVYRVV